ncbi:hypothetical protein Avbf_04104, partial [Armadillidium vulgare]
MTPKSSNVQLLLKDFCDNENSTHCDLCGSSDAAVRCDKCHCQAFCKACDETYHGHPKRANHIRKSLFGEATSGRPPVPQKFADSGGASGSQVGPPQPPPRKNKRGLGLSSSFGSKEQINVGIPHLMQKIRTYLQIRLDIPSISIALPQSIMEINNKASVRKLPSSMPPTPPSAAHTQYPKVQAKSPPLPGRKLSLQQFPSNFEDKRVSFLFDNFIILYYF